MTMTSEEIMEHGTPEHTRRQIRQNLARVLTELATLSTMGDWRERERVAHTLWGCCHDLHKCVMLMGWHLENDALFQDIADAQDRARIWIGLGVAVVGVWQAKEG